MVYRYEETMTAEDMAKECIEVNFKEYTDPLKKSIQIL